MTGSSRTDFAIALSCVLLIMIVWLVTSAHVHDERSEDVAEAQRRNANLAVVLEEQTIRTLKGTNQALSLVKHEFERTSARPPWSSPRYASGSSMPAARTIGRPSPCTWTISFTKSSGWTESLED